MMIHIYFHDHVADCNLSIPLHLPMSITTGEANTVDGFIPLVPISAEI